MKFKLLGRGMAFVAAAAALGLGCSGGSETPRASNLQPLEFRLDWWESPEYIGYFIAQMQGYYADEGLEVTMKAGGGSATAARMLTEGSITLGTVNTHALVREALAQASSAEGGELSTPRVLAIVFPKNPSVIALRSGVRVTKPEDLAGLKIGFPSPSAEAYREFMELLAFHPGLEQRVKLESFFLQAVPQLKSGEIDGLLTYLMEAPSDLEAEGYDFSVAKLGDLGIDVSGQCIAIGRDAKIDPEVLEGFVRASIRGWEYVRAEPDNAAKLFVGRFPDNDLEKTRIVIRQCLSVMPTGGGSPAAAYTDPGQLRASVERSLDVLLQGKTAPVTRETFIRGLVGP
jgi:NitT/TauT family transport system substrate-binding protein